MLGKGFTHLFYCDNVNLLKESGYQNITKGGKPNAMQSWDHHGPGESEGVLGEQSRMTE